MKAGDTLREILFKAKSKRDGGWAEGYYAQLGIDDHAEHYIIQNVVLTKLFDDWEKNMQFMDVEIIPETLCQYTGMVDEYGNKIWENDIVKYDDEIVTIEGDDDYKAFVVVSDTVRENLGEFEECDFEILGNMFDNLDMLKINEADYL